MILVIMAPFCHGSECDHCPVWFNMGMLCVCVSTSLCTSSQISWWCSGANRTPALSAPSTALERSEAHRTSSIPNSWWASSTNTSVFHQTGTPCEELFIKTGWDVINTRKTVLLPYWGPHQLCLEIQTTFAQICSWSASYNKDPFLGQWCNLSKHKSII